MKTRIHADEWKCDGCDKTEMVSVEQLPTARENIPAGWMVGKTERDLTEVEWHAHAIGCVRRAIEAAFSKPKTVPKEMDDNFEGEA